jgi:hypothetical protein
LIDFDIKKIKIKTMAQSETKVPPIAMVLLSPNGLSKSI